MNICLLSGRVGSGVVEKDGSLNPFCHFELIEERKNTRHNILCFGLVREIASQLCVGDFIILRGKVTYAHSGHCNIVCDYIEKTEESKEPGTQELQIKRMGRY